MRPDDRDFDIILPQTMRKMSDNKSIQKFNRGVTIIVGLLFILVVLLHNGVPLYTDWLWFREVHSTQVFWTEVVAKSILFVLFAAGFFLLFYFNTRMALRLSPESSRTLLEDRLGKELADSLYRWSGIGLFIVSLFLSLWAGRMASNSWADWLMFTHVQSFHQLDPVFHRDIGFYIFQLDFLEFFTTFAMLAAGVTLAAVITLHVINQTIQSTAKLHMLPKPVRSQLFILAALLLASLASVTWLSRYGLLQNDNGIFTGPGYVDIHAALPALDVQVFFLVAAAIACLLALRGTSLRAPAALTALWLGTVFIGNALLPGLLQSLIVNPNQLSKETEYIKRNIKFTRDAYNLQSVTEVDNYPATESLTAANLKANETTLNNVRLWDHRYLGKVYEQLQTIKPYYKFKQTDADGSLHDDIDIDRYMFKGNLREVMLAAREMDPTSLPSSAQTWQNRRLSYTHGYGLVMSPVNRAVQGEPEYFVDGFPPKSSGAATGLTVNQPEIYYGTLNNGAVYVDTQQPEFDYPSTSGEGSGQDHYSNFQGMGGITIGNSLLRKVAFAVNRGDWNLLLADNLKPTTRILFRRDIRERIRLAAPFLQEDTDPYLVVNQDNGSLVWMVDCYTVSSNYPYSTPHNIPVAPGAYEQLNYIRNSVKATVNAYNGEINFYLADPGDPIAQAWSHIFPGLLKPFSALPPGLRAHVRYPEDLFRVQRAIYATYHVDDPRIFYLKEDAWTIPQEPTSDPNAADQSMSPYYVVMHLPDLAGDPANLQSNGPEFVLMSPLSPINKEAQNIMGWMCARCDPAHYGQLVLYRFPQQASVLGPAQIVQRINSDKVISPQLSLLRSGGSTASLGNLLVIPIDRSLLYIAPLYVEASTTSGTLPKLAKVIVATSNREVMADTLDEALAALYPGYSANGAPTQASGTPTTASQPTALPPSSSVNAVAPAVRALIDRAQTQYTTAQEKLKKGDFAGYGAATQALQQTLQQLQQSTR